MTRMSIDSQDKDIGGVNLATSWASQTATSVAPRPRFVCRSHCQSLIDVLAQYDR